jgi:mannose-6-phosphate isomerase-like protein (cupin superfamily)
MNQLFALPDLLEAVKQEHPYYEFLRVPAMSLGLYVLPAGAVDRQKPHKQDEIYCLLRGRAKVQLGTEQRSVREGDVIFVPPALEHRFFDIEQQLVLLVVFAPAESD